MRWFNLSMSINVTESCKFGCNLNTGIKSSEDVLSQMSSKLN